MHSCLVLLNPKLKGKEGKGKLVQHLLPGELNILINRAENTGSIFIWAKCLFEEISGAYCTQLQNKETELALASEIAFPPSYTGNRNC